VKIKGILWDMDGVLVDTEELHFQSWERTLSAYNIPFTRELFKETFGMNNWGTVKRLIGHDPEQEQYATISDQKELLFQQLSKGQVQPLPGVIELLQFFKSRNLKQAIASSAPQENIDVVVDELNIRGFFDAIVSGSKLTGKPSPDVFIASAKAIGVSVQNCLVIEDSIPGVEGAKRGGMFCLAVTNTNPAENLKKADYIVNSLLQVNLNDFENYFH